MRIHTNQLIDFDYPAGTFLPPQLVSHIEERTDTENLTDEPTFFSDELINQTSLLSDTQLAFIAEIAFKPMTFKQYKAFESTVTELSTNSREQDNDWFKFSHFIANQISNIRYVLESSFPSDIKQRLTHDLKQMENYSIEDDDDDDYI
ncbi:MAG: hypothetical protein KIG84_08235 [Bacteroidales bacterium]|nr:hypothetical protein [Bacteroidales bacterium]